MRPDRNATITTHRSRPPPLEWCDYVKKLGIEEESEAKCGKDEKVEKQDEKEVEPGGEKKKRPNERIGEGDGERKKKPERVGETESERKGKQDEKVGGTEGERKKKNRGRGGGRKKNNKKKRKKERILIEIEKTVEEDRDANLLAENELNAEEEKRLLKVVEKVWRRVDEQQNPDEYSIEGTGCWSSLYPLCKQII